MQTNKLSGIYDILKTVKIFLSDVTYGTSNYVYSPVLWIQIPNDFVQQIRIQEGKMTLKNRKRGRNFKF
jgi:hypothetical protein